MIAPSLNDIRTALAGVLLNTVNAFPDRKMFTLVDTNQEQTVPKGNTTILHILSPGMVQEGELGGAEALSMRQGVYTVTLGIPKGKSIPQFLDVTGRFETAFRRKRIATKSGCTVWCDEPYTTNAGISPEKDRYLLFTTIPWTAPVGGEEIQHGK